MAPVQTSPARGSDCKRELLRIARAHLGLADAEQQAARGQLLQPALANLTSTHFRLVVMGEIKKGKSTFISELLGQHLLLPEAINVATSTVFKIIYGDKERITVHFLEDEGGQKRKPREISREQMKEFGTEAGNPGNSGEVDFIAIELPHPLLAEGLTIVDTPGVGGLFKLHRDITIRYAPQADVVLFVLDSVESVISEDEIQFLRELQKNTRHIVFLQTKIDLVEDDYAQAWKERNLVVLSEKLQLPVASIPYFLISAKRKELADQRGNTALLQKSGYLEVLKYIHERLVPQRDAILAQRWQPAIEQDLLRTLQQILDRQQIARSSSQTQLADLERQLTENEHAFNHWQNETWPQQYRAFQERAAGLKRYFRNRLLEELSSESRSCQNGLDELRKRCQTADEVNQIGMGWLTDLAAGWTRQATLSLQEYRQSFAHLGGELIGQIAGELKNVRIPGMTVEPSQVREYQVDPVSTIRDTWMTYNAFGSLTTSATKTVAWGSALAVIGGVLTAPVGLTITAVAATGLIAARIWGTVRGYAVARERHRDTAVANLERAVARTASSAQRAAQKSFEDMAAELESNAKTQVDIFRANFKNDFVSRKQECQATRNRTSAEAKSAEEQLRQLAAQYQELIKSLQLVKQQLGTSAG